MLIFCDFIKVCVFTTNHHLNARGDIGYPESTKLADYNSYLAKFIQKCSILKIQTPEREQSKSRCDCFS